MKKIKALMTISMDKVSTTTTCFHCPLKWDCKKWFYYEYSVNSPMCDTTNDSILFGKYDPWKKYGMTTKEATEKNFKPIEFRCVYKKENLTIKELADLLDADSFCEYLRDRGITKI